MPERFSNDICENNHIWMLLMFSIMLFSEIVTIRFAADVRILKYFELKLKVLNCGLVKLVRICNSRKNLT